MKTQITVLALFATLFVTNQALASGISTCTPMAQRLAAAVKEEIGNTQLEGTEEVINISEGETLGQLYFDYSYLMEARHNGRKEKTKVAGFTISIAYSDFQEVCYFQSINAN